MNAQRATDADYRAIKARFLDEEEGELQEVTDAMNDGDYDKALEVTKRITVLMNRINRRDVTGEGYE
ncbi:hypothetical protein [Vreelandella maris]|uniref:hypothetical protein n=1 Tax=Vreelandella maris TaxID=2729617 RepID=UPI0030EF2526